MRLGGIIASSAELLNNFFISKKPVSTLIKEWSVTHRFAGSNDRHKIANIIYDVLRSYNNFKVLAQSDALEEVIFISLLCGKYNISYIDLEFELSTNKYASHLLKYLSYCRDLETRAVKTNNAEFNLANIAPWQKKYFIQSFGADWVQEAAALCSRAPIDIRVNTLKANIEDLKNRLDIKNIDNFINEALRIEATYRTEKKHNLLALDEYKKGYFEIQDFGSQIIAKLVGAKEHMQILDYCAGAGGKSLNMAAHMNNNGRIFAHDKYKYRLAPIYERIRKSGASIVRPLNRLCELDLKHNMDIVVVDAPCSGSGTWRRFPDSKYLLQEHDLLLTIHKQQTILQQASKYVKNGGYLCYMTCSLFAIENDKQIEIFINNNAQFNLDKSKIEAIKDISYFTKYGILLTPFKSNSDGFYFAALKRES